MLFSPTDKEKTENTHKNISETIAQAQRGKYEKIPAT
jgi:hypothetical protein